MKKCSLISTRGFTLIELLIVVAIIAILAAIAVPNFLEAQIRSKVARVNADIRSLTSAVESYRVDNNSYPLATRNVGALNTVNQGLGPNARGYHRRTFVRYMGGPSNDSPIFSVTSPVAYMSSVPSDPFASTNGCAYGYYSGRGDIVAAGNESDKFAWIMWSFGPDRDEASLGQIQSTDGPMLPHNIVIFALNQGRPDLLVAGINSVGDAITYDPSNGTISPGDIWRFVGQ
jgi:type II secretion system protein G